MAVIYSGVAILVYFTEEDKSSILGLGGVFLFLIVLFISIQNSTSFLIKENVLVCRMLFFKKTIDISSIRSIENSNGLYVGWKMNTAWHCIVIKYNKYDELLISPMNEKQFVNTLIQLNPEINDKTTS